MLSKHKLIEEKLRHLASLDKREELERDYNWIKEQEDVNFWKFLSINYLELDRFFTLLDIEMGPSSGWERFVEALGLVLWEDRKWCYQCGFHNGAGPTKVALAKILERKNYDENLGLHSVLLLLKEMDRYDILLQVDWLTLAEKYKKIEGTYSSIKTNGTPFISHLTQVLHSTHSTKSELIDASLESSLYNANKEKQLKQQPQNKRNSSDICILMSYALDAKDFAHKVAGDLRANRSHKKRLKIVMLGDANVKKALVSDCNNILHKWFTQVHYVVPVLSPEYLKQIQNLPTPDQDHDLSLFNRMIYRLTLDQYVSLGSRNLRCRPICPDNFCPQVKKNPVVKGNGLFSVIWNCCNEQKTKEFAVVLMDKPLLPNLLKT